ncbi:MAG: ribosomal protein S18-alanine N-acetyltransferase [Eubacteriales bacterium]|nr:ribosomal protein S18-alanine N-acetyltransferase [Eubacteriales bacterium]
MIISKMTKEHLSGVVEIENSSFTHPWSFDSFASEVDKDSSCCYVALSDDRVIGYAVLNFVLDEGSLLLIAVDKSYRRQGVAKALFTKLMDIAKEKSLSFITLEVRASNESAQAFYLSENFEVVAVRKNYYSKPTEDAVLMTKYL